MDESIRAAKNLRTLQTVTGCNADPDILTINIKAVRLFFTEPEGWQMVVIAFGGLFVITILAFMIFNCRVTCDGSHYKPITEKEDRFAFIDDIESPRKEQKVPDETHNSLPTPTFRLSFQQPEPLRMDSRPSSPRNTTPKELRVHPTLSNYTLTAERMVALEELDLTGIVDIPGVVTIDHDHKVADDNISVLTPSTRSFSAQPESLFRPRPLPPLPVNNM